jgi:CDP-paratose 2-epimerase
VVQPADNNRRAGLFVPVDALVAKGWSATGVVIITGSGGLIGSEAVAFFGALGFDIVGIDNDMRAAYFGAEASTAENVLRNKSRLKSRYQHSHLDIRDRDGISRLFRHYGTNISLVIHTAAQPSHDWAATKPLIDFDVNAVGTANLLQATRQFAPNAPFIFTSTNKVYGDAPNRLPLVEQETRFEIAPGHTYANGIREDLSIDQNLHSLFGVSKASADLLVQEFGRYFGMATVCFRCGTLTGSSHAATEQHGFLAYLMRATMEERRYRVFGHKGKQVRDAIHSRDVVGAFTAFYANPRCGAVYNLGGGRRSNTSMIEAIDQCQLIVGKELNWTYEDQPRLGDHVWWIGDNGKFESHYPDWRLTYDVPRILAEIYEEKREVWVAGEKRARRTFSASWSTPWTMTKPSNVSWSPPTSGAASPPPPSPSMES